MYIPLSKVLPSFVKDLKALQSGTPRESEIKKGGCTWASLFAELLVSDHCSVEMN